jgi:hypothetical protein
MTRFKDGKEHEKRSLAESRRLDNRCRVVRREVPYLGSINFSQQAARRKSHQKLREYFQSLRAGSVEGDLPEQLRRHDVRGPESR